MVKIISAVFAASFIATPALAAESISYTYDARGRVIAVVRSGSVNNGQSTTYALDKAHNRINVTTTGAPH